MPGKIKVKVLAGRNLPVMDRASDTTDAFVEIKFGGITHKTDVCRKSLNPHWSSTEWYRFEVDESELQDEPLQLRLMDHDTYSANDAIGKVVISLAPLLAREIHNTKGVGTTPGGAVLSGWIPVFDTMHGIRGELNVIVKVELFTDFNRYKTSSCGVQFFHCPSIPPGYKAIAVHGFVEELVVNDDPEYQWIDKIRTPRASNEARQVAFIKLSNQVQRLVGLKAAELGANAVVGYQQDFDLEGEAGVVARAIGTAVSIVPPPMPSQSMSIPPCTQQNEREKEQCEKEKGSPRHARHESYGGREPVATSQPTQSFSLNSTSTPVGIHRRSSDSDLSVTPKGGSLNASAGNGGSGGGAILRPSMNSNNLEMLEYPFLTMTEYPPGFIVHIGGTVCARSVKLVDAGGESAARAAWWAELRTELRAHARALRCNAVIAYTESAAICEDVCVLSASGTAAVINLDCEFHMESEMSTSVPNGPKTELEPEEPELPEYCTMAHVPYSPGAGPYRVELSTCGGCKRARVPAVLLATCAKPSRMQSYARAVTVTAVAARVRRAPPASEPGARDISDQLPFLEYELHKLLLAKLRMQGANALFSLQTQIAIGERYVMALASGTAVRLAALPPPTPPRIKASETDKNALEIQRALWDSFTANKAANGYDIAGSADQIPNGALPDLETEEPAAAPALDLCVDKDACVLELDEAEDVETAKTLAMRRMHMQVFTSGMKAAPKAPPHAFAQVWRARLQVSGQSAGASTAAERHVARALDGVTYKLRRLQPCALVAPRFQLELPEDEIQLVVSGAAIPLLDPNRPEQILPEIVYPESTTPSPQPTHSNGNHSNGNHGSGNHNNGGHNHGNGTGDADDDIFTLDEEQLVKQTQPSEVGDEKAIVTTGQVSYQAPTMVSLTSLSHVSGSRTLRRICALRLLFVRETTAVRELGGLSGFLHTFTCEVLAIVRAYTAALGGNALTSFYITQLMLQDNAHKNQGQCLLSVGGDVVHITY
ncbi:C2 domain-containing protein 5 isoform X4 [Pectinophora gossypiella]|uniref:C2 domain-containing protein 5 isoform X4 n=1 Tax=Pectinophora gossypiella TaxID=13191 RepID=UPI00214E47A1|nr:C2 domain-containing protein 5 isoform X4 [Pectinophora gossypiella]